MATEDHTVPTTRVGKLCRVPTTEASVVASLSFLSLGTLITIKLFLTVPRYEAPVGTHVLWLAMVKHNKD